jgi:hypothetical protein
MSFSLLKSPFLVVAQKNESLTGMDSIPTSSQMALYGGYASFLLLKQPVPWV